jgi:hypothetical protein
MAQMNTEVLTNLNTMIGQLEQIDEPIGEQRAGGDNAS